MPSESLRIHLLGSFRLLHGDQPVAGFDQARLQELLAYLLLHRNSPVSRQHLAFLFWPDSTEEQARTNLRNLWHRLRRALPDGHHFLIADELALQWRSDTSCWLDVAIFEDHLRLSSMILDTGDQLQHLEQAVVAYGGDLLPGCYSDWLLVERERLAQAYASTLERLATRYEERRDYRQAIDHARALLRHDPLHEPAYAHLMHLQALNNDRAAALHTYHTCATVLRRELDVEPGDTTHDLYERLLNARAPAMPQSAPAQTEAAIPLVGREAEWAQLQQAWRRAANCRSLLLICGEAGIGKTRLAEALAEWVGRQGIPVLRARSYAAGGELAYAPVIAWLRSAPLAPLADPWLCDLARLLPEIETKRSDLPPPEPLTESWQRLRLFEALEQAILTGRSAVLLLLDDLQWCDRDTLDWLHFLLAARPGLNGHAQLLVVATLRAEESEASPALLTWRAELARLGKLVEIELGPLSQNATLALANSLTGRSFDQALGSLLFLGTEGHPLFIVEMVRAGFGQDCSMIGQHALAVTNSPPALPVRVRQVLEARLAQLSAPARDTVELAAAVGRAFTFDVLAAAGDVSEESLVRCLDECWRKRIIREQGETTYDFSHDKLREAAYAGLSQTRRRWLHGRVAQALERVHTADLDGIVGVLAGHYEAAGQAAQALACYGRAAAVARRVYAHGDAQVALERAIALLDTLPAAIRCQQAAHLQEELGDLREMLAQHVAARDAYAAAMACVTETDAVTQARLHRKIGKTLETERRSYDQVAAKYTTAEALLGAPEQADAGAAWWEEWCQIQIDHLILLYWWRLPDEMAQHIDRVRPLIERHGTPVQKAALFSNLARQTISAHRFAPSDTAVAYARAALGALPPFASVVLRAPHHFGLGFCLLWRGDLIEAGVELRAALAMAEQTGDIRLQARNLVYLLILHRRQGCDAEVERLARRGLAVAESAEMLDYIGATRAGMAWIAWRRGDLNEAERLAQTALESWRLLAVPYPLYWQALWPLIGLTLAQNRLAEAIAHAQRLHEPGQQVLPGDLAMLTAAAITAWGAGQPDAAQDFLCRALNLAQKTNFA